MPHVCRYAALTACHVSPPTTCVGVGLGVCALSNVPSPSCPAEFSPQQYAVALVVTPHVWYVPALSAANADTARTGPGTARSAVVPSPSWPLKLAPQQDGTPSVITPHVCAEPGSTDAKVNAPTTWPGLWRPMMIVPSP